MSSTEIRRLMTLVEDANNPSMPVNITKIKALVRKYFNMRKIEFEVQDDGTVNILKNCHIRAKDNIEFAQFPVKFGRIEGDFAVQDCGLETLVGGPTEIRGTFDIKHNKLSSLHGSPQVHGGHYYCNGNPLISLDGLPTSFTGNLYCDWHRNLPLLRLLNCSLVSTSNAVVNRIMNQYAGNPSRANIVQCHKQLINAGFAGNASL